MKQLLNILLQKRMTLIIIPLILALFLLLTSGPRQQDQQSPNPQPTQELEGQIPGIITGEPTPFYDDTGTKKLIDKLDHPIPLNRTDQEAKQIIINNLNKQSGITAETENYIIEYVKSADMFMVEIRTIDVGGAKKEVAAWFTANGFSERAVCELPVVFYLNFNVSQQLQNDGMTFNPLAEGC